MKLFFVDDSYQSQGGLFGQGGVILDDASLRPLADDLRKVKAKHKIQGIELKWSPPRDHYLRTKFKGSRTALYKDVIAVANKHEATYACAVTLLPECYGMKLHDWTVAQAKKWASEEELVWLAERYQAFLTGAKANGMIIMDKTSREDEKELARSFEFDLYYGTRFQKLPNICLNVLSADSSLTPALEIADLVVGVTVSWLGGGEYAEELFPLLFQRFLRSDHSQKTKILAGSPSSVISGYGLKLFPRELEKIGRKRFEPLDAAYTYSTQDGFVLEEAEESEEAEVPF